MSRFELTLQYVRTYVLEWFDQNPLGQVGIIILRDRLSETVIPMGGETLPLAFENAWADVSR